MNKRNTFVNIFSDYLLAKENDMVIKQRAKYPEHIELFNNKLELNKKRYTGFFDEGNYNLS